jgi:hypothetical protein
VDVVYCLLSSSPSSEFRRMGTTHKTIYYESNSVFIYEIKNLLHSKCVSKKSKAVRNFSDIWCDLHTYSTSKYLKFLCWTNSIFRDKSVAPPRSSLMFFLSYSDISCFRFVETVNTTRCSVLFQIAKQIYATVQHSAPQHTGNINAGISKLYIQPHKHITDTNYGVKS